MPNIVALTCYSLGIKLLQQMAKTSKCQVHFQFHFLPVHGWTQARYCLLMTKTKRLFDGHTGKMVDKRYSRWTNICQTECLQKRLQNWTNRELQKSEFPVNCSNNNPCLVEASWLWPSCDNLFLRYTIELKDTGSSWLLSNFSPGKYQVTALCTRGQGKEKIVLDRLETNLQR